LFGGKYAAFLPAFSRFGREAFFWQFACQIKNGRYR
jgi:hypothetical protein